MSELKTNAYERVCASISVFSEVKRKSQVEKSLLQNTDQSANDSTPPQHAYKIQQDHERDIDSDIKK